MYVSGSNCISITHHQVLSRSIEAQDDEALLKSFIELADHCPKFLRSQLENIIELMLKVLWPYNCTFPWQLIAHYACTLVYMHNDNIIIGVWSSLGDAIRVFDGLMEAVGPWTVGYYSRECSCHDEEACCILSTNWYKITLTFIKNIIWLSVHVFSKKNLPVHTVTQGLHFMLQVEEDEEWLTADSADEEEDNTRWAGH